MAVIEGATTASLTDVDSAGKAVWVANKPKDVVGAYGMGGLTGVLPAALASGSVLWGMRLGPTGVTKRAIITRLTVRMYVRTVASVFTDVSIELIRYSAANMTGGTAATFTNKHQGGSAYVASAALAGGPEGGDARIATTAGLTTTGVTFDATSSHTFLYVPVISAASPAVGQLFERQVENDAGLEHPYELTAGEGICFRTVGALPTGLTLQAHLAVSWSERT